MAFCPNCGTPNTDQAEKCVSCSFELAPKAKAKFKGTIMMSGVQAPAAPKAPGAPAPAPIPAPQAAPAPEAAAPRPVSNPPGKNLAFEKTMMGGMGMVPPMQPPGAGQASPPGPAIADIGRAATLEQPAPQFSAPAVLTPPVQPPVQPPPQSAPVVSAPEAKPAPTFSGGGFGGTTGDFGGGLRASEEFPQPPKSNTGKILAIVVAALLVLACVIGGAVFLFAKKNIDGLSEEGPALEWRTRVAQSLTNVQTLCQTSCDGAAVYFHPQKQSELVAQAKDLTPERLAKLVNPAQSEARMLDATDDKGIATALGLDPQQCVRIVSGGAKVVGCSVPEPGAAASLRIVTLSGLASL